MITIVSVVFIPNTDNLKRFKNSIQSILTSDLTNVQKIIIDGWASSDNLWKEVENIVKDCSIISLNRREKNVGKSTIINENIPDTSLVVYSDSDIIVFPDTIQRMKNLSEKFDIIIPDQLEDCRHYKLLYKNGINYNDELIYLVERSEGIAGGFIMMKTDVLKNIKFQNKGPYGSDDVEFFQQAIQKYKIVVCTRTVVIHPFDDNKEYYRWKVNMSLSAYNKTLSIKEIDERINSSMLFWNVPKF